MHGVPEWCAAVTTTDLYTAEHGAGLHRVFKPLGCADCPTTEPREAIASRAEPGARSNAGFKSLGEAISEIKQRRNGALFGDGQPPDPEPLESADGNPWCDRCRGARWLRIEYDRRPSEYRRCPDCLHAQWAIQQRVDRLLGTLPPVFASCRLQTFPTAD